MLWLLILKNWNYIVVYFRRRNAWFFRRQFLLFQLSSGPWGRNPPRHHRMLGFHPETRLNFLSIYWTAFVSKYFLPQSVHFSVFCHEKVPRFYIFLSPDQYRVGQSIFVYLRSGAGESEENTTNPISSMGLSNKMLQVSYTRLTFDLEGSKLYVRQSWHHWQVLTPGRPNKSVWFNSIEVSFSSRIGLQDLQNIQNGNLLGILQTTVDQFVLSHVTSCAGCRVWVSFCDICRDLSRPIWPYAITQFRRVRSHIR